MPTDLIIAIFIYVHIFFLIALAKRNFSLIDIGWGLGIFLVALISYMHQPLSFKNALLLLVVTIWGLRLSLYIYKRGRGKGEDPRYTKFRNEWKPYSNLQAYLKVFLFQGILMLIVSLPVSVGMSSQAQTISLVNWIGFGLWLFFLSLEIWSDYYLQLWKMKPENKGKICTTGPWTICRFPNYLGEVMLWYGIYLISFEINSFWTIIGPLTLNFLIYKVTGIKPLEDKYLKRQDYLEYSKKVPKFIPFTRP
jgi:steroid 5-alpha reductase family enzyme